MNRVSSSATLDDFVVIEASEEGEFPENSTDSKVAKAAQQRVEKKEEKRAITPTAISTFSDMGIQVVGGHVVLSVDMLQRIGESLDKKEPLVAAQLERAATDNSSAGAGGLLSEKEAQEKAELNVANHLIKHGITDVSPDRVREIRQVAVTSVFGKSGIATPPGGSPTEFLDKNKNRLLIIGLVAISVLVAGALKQRLSPQIMSLLSKIGPIIREIFNSSSKI